MISAVLAACWWLVFRSLTRGDPRRLRIAIVLLVACFFTLLAALELLGYLGVNLVVLVGIAGLLLPASVLFLVVVLLRNGLQMLRKEGRSLGNSLSGLLGLAFLALPVIGIALPIALGPDGFAASLILLYVCAVAGLSFLVFWVFALWYRRRAPRPAPRAVVVLGAGLIDGQVGPLLRGRLDTGRTAYFREVPRGGGPPPEGAPADGGAASGCFLVPSGGQGADEPRPEAQAMAEYLLAHGAPADDVVPEDRSTTTEENLRFSRALVDEEWERRGRGRLERGSEPGAAPDEPAGGTPESGAGPTTPRAADVASEPGPTTPAPAGQLLVATNDYHVPRTALLSRRTGVDADVIGSKTAAYFAPSAFLREFAAIVKMHFWLHAALVAPAVVAALVLVIGSVQR